jgi:hypothetical protein
MKKKKTPELACALEVPEESPERKMLFDFLKALGIQVLKVHYSGSGDSGQTDDMTTIPDKLSKLLDEQLNEKETLRSYLDTFTWEKIEDEESGFYNNEGGYGEIIFDVAERTIKMEHNNYTQETVYSEHDL